MSESNSQENRTIDLFGPQFLIETGSRAVGKRKRKKEDRNKRNRIKE